MIDDLLTAMVEGVIHAGSSVAEAVADTVGSTEGMVPKPAAHDSSHAVTDMVIHGVVNLVDLSYTVNSGSSSGKHADYEIHKNNRDSNHMVMSGKVDFSESELIQAPCNLKKYFILGHEDKIEIKLTRIGGRNYLYFESQHQFSNIRSVRKDENGNNLYLLVEK